MVLRIFLNIFIYRYFIKIYKPYQLIKIIYVDKILNKYIFYIYIMKYIDNKNIFS